MTKTLEQVIKENPSLTASKALEIFKEQEAKGNSKKLKKHLKNKELCKELNNEGVHFFKSLDGTHTKNSGYEFFYKISNFVAVNPDHPHQTPFINCESETIHIYINPLDSYEIKDDEVFGVRIEKESDTSFDFDRKEAYQKISEAEYNNVRFNIQQLKNKLVNGI